VAGHDVVQESDAVRQNIGVVFQDTTLDNYLTGEQNLRFHADLYGVPRSAVAPRLRQVLEMVDLWDRRGSVVGTYSGGMKRRLEIAGGLLHVPRVLFLDEPTVGLDPQTRSGHRRRRARASGHLQRQQWRAVHPATVRRDDPADPPALAIAQFRKTE
jgi:ABC-2 type transport system ATP-binding protein